MSFPDFIPTALDTIEANLCEALTVADVASAVSVSLFHFSRSFSRATGHGPYDYLMRRRLCAAAGDLTAADEKIIDIAFKYQFQAAETFSRAFRRMFGLSPREARAGDRIDSRLLWGRPSEDYLTFLAREGPRRPAARRLPALRVAVKDGLIDESLENMRGRSRLYMLGKNNGENSFKTGIVLGKNAKEPPDAQIHEIGAGDWACLTLPPNEAALNHGRQYLYRTWWPKTQGSSLPLVELYLFPNETVSGLPVLCLPLMVL